MSQAIREALRTKYAAPEWALLEEVRHRATGGERSADAIACNMWESNAYKIIGFEIKSSRADWLRELKDPCKADVIAAFCDEWIIVTPPGLVKPDELPQAWGLMELKGNGLHTVRKAPKLEDRRTLTRGFVASMMRRGWRRNQSIARQLQSHGLSTVPLLLVQVGNGDEAITEALEFFTRDMHVPLHAIGMHSANEPDPVMMAAIANDSSKQVLIFKQSAGTGFDAPRAFVLSSTKPVTDPDFATQFIGRVMRVAPELQRTFPDPAGVPPELDTAYVYLANAEAQVGFAQAAEAIKSVKSELEGQTEALHIRRTAHGGVALTNRVTDQAPLSYDIGLLPVVTPDGKTVIPAHIRATNPITDSSKIGTDGRHVFYGESGVLFGPDDAVEVDELDQIITGDAEAPGSVQVAVSKPARSETPRKVPSTTQELLDAFSEVGLRTIPLSNSLAVPKRFITEARPVFDAMSLDVEGAIQKLPIEPTLQANAVKAALNRMTEREIYTELFTGRIREEDVQVITDAGRLISLTLAKLSGLGIEEQGAIDAIELLSKRLFSSVEQAWFLQDDAPRPQDGELRRKARQAACWVLSKRFEEFEELLRAQVAAMAELHDAQALPHYLLVPSVVPILPARKSSYHIIFPEQGSVIAARDALTNEARARYQTQVFCIGDSLVSVATMDGTHELNEGETLFVKALDRESFVHWWHRNPQGKPYSAGLVRADSPGLFYPDFVVCMEHVTGEPPLLRLIDPKHDVKDAERKARHVSRLYGRVLFLTKDQNRFKIVNEDGTLGEVVDFDDLSSIKEWMREVPPVGQ